MQKMCNSCEITSNVTWTHLIYIYMGWVQVTHGITLNNVIPLNIF